MNSKRMLRLKLVASHHGDDLDYSENTLRVHGPSMAATVTDHGGSSPELCLNVTSNPLDAYLFVLRVKNVYLQGWLRAKSEEEFQLEAQDRELLRRVSETRGESCPTDRLQALEENGYILFHGWSKWSTRVGWECTEQGWKEIRGDD